MQVLFSVPNILRIQHQTNCVYSYFLNINHQNNKPRKVTNITALLLSAVVVVPGARDVLSFVKFESPVDSRCTEY